MTPRALAHAFHAAVDRQIDRLSHAPQWLLIVLCNLPIAFLIVLGIRMGGR